jgi:DNA-binding NarL/FixJ family response regulator
MKYTIRVGADRYPIPPSNGFQEITKILKERNLAVNSVNDLIKHLTQLTDVNDLPTRITLDVDEVLYSSISPADLAATIRTTHAINCMKLNSLTTLYLTLRTKHTISEAQVTTLKNAGFNGLTPRGPEYGVPAAVDSWKELYAHDTCWPAYLIDKSQPVIDVPTIVIPEIQLTARQKQILWFIQYQGATNRAIAQELNISESAVKMHITVILKKYGLQNRTQLASLKRASY